MRKKRMINILKKAYLRHFKGMGMCDTLDHLEGGGEISFNEEILIKSFLIKYYSNDKLNSSFWLSNRLGDYNTKKGTELRKNILLDAIGFIESTGVTE